MAAQDTKQQLMDATITLIATEGVAGVTVRKVASAANANSAAISYHFGGIDELIRLSYRTATQRVVDTFAARLDTVNSAEELMTVACDLSANAREEKHAAILASALAAAHHDPQHAAIFGEVLEMWRQTLEDALLRLTANKQLHKSLDVTQLTQTLTAATVGMIAIDGIESKPLGTTINGLTPFAKLFDKAMQLVPGPIARALLK